MVHYHGKIPPTHPYLAEITLDPADYYPFSCLTEDAPELRVLDVDKSQPDIWTVFVACASAEAASRLKSAW